MFKVTRNKGVHFTFENGWTVSVQWGGGNYCDNYDAEIGRNIEVPPSTTAEVAAWASDGNLITLSDGYTVMGHQTPEQVLALMNDIASREPQ